MWTSKSGRQPKTYNQMDGLEEVVTSVGKSKAACLVLKNSVVGESGLLFKADRRINVVARTEVQTLAMTRDAYDAILSRYPADADLVAANALRIVTGDKKCACAMVPFLLLRLEKKENRPRC